MRRFLAPSALSSIEEEAGVRRDLISLVPWWQKSRVLVVVAGGGNNKDVIKRVVSDAVQWLPFRSVIAAHVEMDRERRWCSALLLHIALLDP